MGSNLVNNFDSAFNLRHLFQSWGQKRLPQTNGRFYLPGLHHPVTIHRDKWGIPHIQARHRHDLFFAQGVVHAQDRLWQMELNRRVARGTLSALFGPITLETDQFSRTLGFTRLAAATWDRLDNDIRADIEAYTAGVNAYLQSGPPLPLEFTLLRHEPAPWQPLDSVVYGRLQMWAMTMGASGEPVHAELLQKLGAEKTAELLPHYPPHNPVTLPPRPPRPTWPPLSAPFLGKGSHDGIGRGSNGWVIAPWRSQTGHAILCNDMHLPIGTPSIWYFVHLHSQDGWHVAGFSQPGLPYVLVGQNDFVAWGATLAYTDCEDYFIEQFHPMDATRYRFGNEWRKADIFEERIEVKGQKDHLERVVVTHHGPIVSSEKPETADNPTALSLSSTALQTEAAFVGFVGLNRAKNWQEFVTAVSHIEAPPLNLLYADRQGNIGYYVSGHVPIRAKGDGLLPNPGWTGEDEWIGYIPFADMPHAYNPPQGYILSANHRITDHTYPHYLGQTWRNGNRARRLEQLITAQKQVSPADCQRFQNDFTCLPALELIKKVAHLHPTNPDAQASLELLRGWDGWLGPESIPGAVYEVWLRRLAITILTPHLGETFTHQYLGLGPHPTLIPVNDFQGYWPITLLRLLENPHSALLPLTQRDALLERCLAETTAELRTLSPSSPFPPWGHLHRITFAHALGAQPPLDRIFNQGPFPIGGDGDTPAQTSTRANAPYDNNAISISSRFIANLGDLNQTLAMIAPGQSGQLGSPHYGDLISPWLNGRYFQIAWEEETAVSHTLHLLPTKP